MTLTLKIKGQGKRVLAEQTFLHCCASSVPSKRIDVEWSVVVLPLRGCEAWSLSSLGQNGGVYICTGILICNQQLSKDKVRFFGE
jgi:hypothetical protein